MQDVIKTHFTLSADAINKEVARWSREDPTFRACPTAQQAYGYGAYIGRGPTAPAYHGPTIDLVAAVSSKLAALR